MKTDRENWGRCYRKTGMPVVVARIVRDNDRHRPYGLWWDCVSNLPVNEWKLICLPNYWQERPMKENWFHNLPDAKWHIGRAFGFAGWIAWNDNWVGPFDDYTYQLFHVAYTGGYAMEKVPFPGGVF